MSVVKQILLCLALVAVGAAGWYVYQNPQLISAARETDASGSGGPAGQAAGRRAPGMGGPGGTINVIGGPVTIDDSADVATALGTAKSARAVTIFPQVSGVVKEVLFTPGQPVKQGEVLVRLEDDEFSVAVDRAKISLADARKALERARQLAASKTITSVALSEAETAERVAEIELRVVEIALSRRILTAPFAGITGLSEVTVGDLVTTSTEIATLDDLSAIRVAFELPERRAGQVRVGQTVKAAAQGLPGSEFHGEISAVDSRVDEATRTLRMEAVLRNEDQALKPGMAVTVTFAFDNPGQISVPSLSVQWDRQGSFVWKIDGEAVRRTPVAIVSRLSGSVIVKAELKAGDRVVVEGVQRLREGTKIADIGDTPEGGADEPGTAAAGASARAGG
jgi:RND family efflux transporter MFP subunit